MRPCRIIAAVTALLAFFALSSSPTAQELKRIRIAYPSNSICCLPLFAALQWKIFEENGLQAEIIQVRSQVGNVALAGGEIQYFAGVGPASLSATLRGMASRAVWFASDQLIYSLIARPELRNLKDLRNKKIGLTGLGGTMHVALQIALESVGESPKSFVYLSLSAAQLLPAVETGAIDAAVFSPPFVSFAQKKGLKEVLDVGSRVKMPLGGLTTLATTIQNRPDELKRVIRSLQTARQQFLKSKEKSRAMIADFLKVDQQAAEDTYLDVGRTAGGSGVPTREGIDQIVKSLQAAGQFTDRKVAFEEVADDKIAKEVARGLGYKIN